MRKFLIAGVMSFSFVFIAQHNAVAQQSDTHVPMPQKGEIINKDSKIASCKRRAQLAGKDSKVDAKSCKKSLGQEVCEQFYTKKACSSAKE